MTAHKIELYERLEEVVLSVDREQTRFSSIYKPIGNASGDRSFSLMLSPLDIRAAWNGLKRSYDVKVCVVIPDHEPVPDGLAKDFPPTGRTVPVFVDGAWTREGPWQQLLPLVLDELESQLRAIEEERLARQREEAERKQQAIKAIWAAAENAVNTALARRSAAVEGR